MPRSMHYHGSSEGKCKVTPWITHILTCEATKKLAALSTGQRKMYKALGPIPNKVPAQLVWLICSPLEHICTFKCIQKFAIAAEQSDSFECFWSHWPQFCSKTIGIRLNMFTRVICRESIWPRPRGSAFSASWAAACMAKRLAISLLSVEGMAALVTLTMTLSKSEDSTSSHVAGPSKPSISEASSYICHRCCSSGCTPNQCASRLGTNLAST